MATATPATPTQDVRTPAFYTTQLETLKAQYDQALNDYHSSYLAARPSASADPGTPYDLLNITSNSDTLTQAQTGLIDQSKALYRYRATLELDQTTLASCITKLNGEIKTIEEENVKLTSQVRALTEDSATAGGKLGDAVNEYNAHLLGIWLMGILCVGGAVAVGVTYKGIP